MRNVLHDLLAIWTQGGEGKLSCIGEVGIEGCRRGLGLVL